MNSTQKIAEMLQRAIEIENTDPDEASLLYCGILKQDPANLAAHNALEKMHSPRSFGHWMRINCAIDPRDDIFHFFARHELARNPIREYLTDGWRTLSELMILLESVEQPLVKTANVLEFASGFGRFTRHLVKALPGRVTCSDIMPGSNEFLREQFGVDVFESSHRPEEIDCDDQFELVFVLSMFTHVPPAMWAPWLIALKRFVKPGGLLVFSVHNEDFAREAGVTFKPDGTHFIASSESASLEGHIYGTTFTTREFVENSVLKALGIETALYQTFGFWSGQDAVVVRL